MATGSYDPATEGERRQRPRQRVLKGALLVFGDLARTFDCTIRNLTETGAKVVLASTLGTPTAFYLLIRNEGRMVPARAIWRTETEIGIEFTGPWQPHHG